MTGEVQLNCVSLLGWFSFVVVASGELTNAPKPSPVPSPPPLQYKQWYWTLDQTLILLRGVSCQVIRSDPFFQCRRRRLARSGSGRRSISWGRPRSC